VNENQTVNEGESRLGQPTLQQGGSRLGQPTLQRRRVFLFINGILTRPGDAEGWTDRAVTWTHLHTEARGEKFEYAAGVLLRMLHQQARAEKFARMIAWYLNAKETWEVNLVGHSNGCDIILRALRVLSYGAEINAIHLIAPACEGDFERNGLNGLLSAGLVQRVEVYMGEQDSAMEWARLSKFSPFPFLRFGDLGRTGPIKTWMSRESLARVRTYSDPFYEHSTWFERGARFEETMRMVTELRLNK
jgi:pimeloyl-ACP methyl ester carboxylesterase